MSNQINEISKKTLGSYIKKASNDILGKSYSAGAQNAKGEHPVAAKNLNKAIKRLQGINVASSKVSNHGLVKVPGSDVHKMKAGKSLIKKESTEESYEMKDLLDLVENKNIVDFKSRIGEILESKSLTRFVESSDDEIEDDIEIEDEDLEFEFDVEDEEVTEEQLQWIAENITEEEFEGLAEASKNLLNKYIEEGRGKKGKMRHSQEDDEWGDREHSRKSNKPVRKNKEMSEEVEDRLDEISKKTLGSYIKKASINKANAAADLSGGGLYKKPADVARKNYAKRTKGIVMAVDKLTKESTEESNG